MKNKCYVFFPPMQYIAVDAAIPLIVTLASKQWKIYSVFYSLQKEKPYYTSTYMDILKKHSELIDLKMTKIKSLHGLFRFGCYTGFLIKVLFSANVRLITFLPAKNILDKLLKICGTFKRSYCLSKVSAPIHKEYYEAYFVRALNDQNIRQNIFGKKAGEFPAYRKKDYIGKCLIHSDYEKSMADIVGYPDDRIIIGYPKIFSTWLDFVSTYEVRWSNQLLDNKQEFITILLLSKQVYLYEPNDSVDVLLREAIKTLRIHYKDDLIVIKNKPRAGVTSNDWVVDYVQSLNDENIIISSIPTPFLAENSKLMVMMGDTTACFDFIIREVPSIEHARYSEDTLQWYPDISCWSTYKVKRTSSVEELNEAILNISTGDFKAMPLPQVKQIVSHREDYMFVEKL